MYLLYIVSPRNAENCALPLITGSTKRRRIRIKSKRRKREVQIMERRHCVFSLGGFAKKDANESGKLP